MGTIVVFKQELGIYPLIRVNVYQLFSSTYVTLQASSSK